MTTHESMKTVNSHIIAGPHVEVINDVSERDPVPLFDSKKTQTF